VKTWVDAPAAEADAAGAPLVAPTPTIALVSTPLGSPGATSVSLDGAETLVEPKA